MHTDEQELAAIEFEFQGVRLGDSLKEVATFFPNATLTAESDATATYVSAAQGVTHVELSFIDGLLYAILLSYSADQVEGVGGAELIFARLIDLFGDPDEHENGTSVFQWAFLRSARVVSFAANKSRVIVHIADSEIMRESMLRKRVGF